MRRARGALLGLALAVAAAFAGPHATAVEADPAPGRPAPPPAVFRVVVHAENPADALAAPLVSKIFLKRVTRWDDGSPIEPVDQAEASTVRRAFSDAVHRKSVSAIKSFWQRMIFSGRDVPPTEEPTDTAVLAFVAGRRGAIGYVAAGTELGDGVKELKLTD